MRLRMEQREAARAAGVHEQTYWRWESGAAIPSGKLAALAGVGFDIQYIVTGERLPAPGHIREPESVYSLSAADRAVYALRLVVEVGEELGILKSLSAEQLQLLVGYAHQWAPTRESLRAFIETAMRAGLGAVSDGNKAGDT